MDPTDTFPRFPAKLRHPALVKPADFVGRYLSGVRTPARCILVWNPAVVEGLVRRFRARPIRGLTGAYVLPGPQPSVGIVLPRGVGAPTTVIRAEELIALGTREIIGIGYAGSLTRDVGPGEVVLCDRAIRDEGTSHHYAHPSVPARPSPSLREWAGRALQDAHVVFRTGPSWTTDAPYRETRAELRHYRREGILTVEMEAASLFVLGRHRRVRTASVFVISDVLDERGWTPHFHRVRDELEEVAAVLLDGSRRVPRTSSPRRLSSASDLPRRRPSAGR
ncbi:MAG: nucleoside phosphorylase [Thermoplasmata archaeon]